MLTLRRLCTWASLSLLGPTTALAAPNDAEAPQAPSTATEPGAAAPGSESKTSTPSAAPVSDPSQASSDQPQTDDDRPDEQETLRDAWLRRYVAARDLLLQGKFSDAASALQELQVNAPNPKLAQIAREVARLAKDLESQGSVLVTDTQLQNSDFGARNSGQRSTDEIAFLYINTVIYGIGTGLFTGVLAEGESTEAFILPMFGVAGAGITAVAWLDGLDLFRYGTPQAITTGLYLGFSQGILWNIYGAASHNEISEKAVVGTIWGAASAGALIGGILGSVEDSTPGRASWVGSSALWMGTVAGLGTSALVGDEDEGAAPLGAAIGHAAGAVAGLLSAKAVAPSIARVRFIDMGAVAGGLLSGGLYLLLAQDEVDGATFAGATAAGIGAGVAAGAWLTSGMHPDRLAREGASSETASFRTQLVPTRDGGLVSLQGRF